MLHRLAQWISDAIVRYLSKPTWRYAPFFAPDPEILRRSLRPGDVLLVEGNTRLAAVIKHLTQSTWSHATLFVGEAGGRGPDGEVRALLEAEVDTGVVTVPLSRYAHFNTRICRPIGLSADDKDKVVAYALAQIGRTYDRKRIVDLARYLFPYPPVPVFIRRRLLAIGARDPTKAICSALIAESFASIRYPVLPERMTVNGTMYGVAPYVKKEIEHIRTRGLYTPRDFDVSPYFAVVKPGLDQTFDFHKLVWEPDAKIPKSTGGGAAALILPPEPDADVPADQPRHT